MWWIGDWYLANMVEVSTEHRNIFRITRRRVTFIQHGLKATGTPPVDRRGQHKSRPHALTEADLQTDHAHIKPLHGCKSYYSLSETRRIYLLDELNISKLYKMYKQQHSPMYVIGLGPSKRVLITELCL